MLTDAQIDILMIIYRQRMQAVTDEFIERMAKHVAQIGELAPSDINRIEQMQRVRLNMKEVQRKLAEACIKSEGEIGELFKVAAKSNMRFAAQLFGLESVPKMSPRILQILQTQLRATGGEFANLSRTTIESGIYRKVVDEGISAVQAGVSDYRSQIRSSLGNAAMNGMRVTYPSGRTMRADSAMRMNILDGVRSLNNAMLQQLGEEFGADGVEISAHMLCARDHLDYQGKQYTSERFAEIQGVLQRPFGMWNCRHAMYPIIMGISRPAYSREKLQEYRENSLEKIEIGGVTKTRYEWTQEMRKTETAIRYKKDAGNAFRAAGDEEGQRRVQRDINVLKERYKDIAAKADVNTAWERTQVAGYKDVRVPKNSSNTESTRLNMSRNGDIIKARVIDAEGQEVYKYPKTDRLSKAKTLDEINEIFTDYEHLRVPLLDESLRALPIENQRAIAEGIWYVTETYKNKGLPRSVSVQKVIDKKKSTTGMYYPGTMKIKIKLDLSESEHYLTAVHEAIHHFDRTGEEAKYAVSKALRELRAEGYSQFQCNEMRFKITNQSWNDDDLLAYSIEAAMKNTGINGNALSQKIVRIFNERNRRQK